MLYQAKVLGFAVPDIGWLLALVFRAWIFALYAFEYTWINAGRDCYCTTAYH